MSVIIVADYDGRGWGPLEHLISKLARKAGTDFRIESEPPTTSPRGRTVEQRRLTFSGARDAHVHGWVCVSGYVAHIAA